MNRQKPESLLKPKLLAVSVAACFALSAGPSRANPTGPTVVYGGVGFAGMGTSALTVTNQAGSNAIINWNGFSIGINELTRFQQFANLAVLNRVTGSDVSRILGALQSDGRVFLINPNGIIFGASARVDTAGLVASSLNMSNQDFLSGKLRFTEVPGAGAVVNNGVIETATGGRVFLVAPTVENNGLVHTPQGEIVLAAGKEVELVDAAGPAVTVKVAANEQAVNVGQLVAEGGKIGMYGALVQNSGVVEAGGAMVGPGGEIRLVATQDLTINAGSTVTANGTSGGTVVLQAVGGTNLIGGTVEAKGSSGNGGEVQALGVRVGVVGHGVIDASGDMGGGTVLVGGDAHGANPDVQNAERTYIGTDGVIRADAVTTGNGGRVIAWADEDTGFYGSISARGGSQSGNGGFVETSGKQVLQASGIANVGASNGAGGTWLLDPDNVTIVAGTGPNDAQAAYGIVGFFDGFGTDSSIGVNGLVAGIVYGGSVDVAALNNITLATSIDLSSNPGDLTLRAGNNIALGSFNITTAGNLHLSAADSGASTYGSAAGAITSNSGFGNVTTNGGNFDANGASVTLGAINTVGGSYGGGYANVSAVGGDVSTGAIRTGGGTVGINSSIGNVTVNGAINTSNVLGDTGFGSNNGNVGIIAYGNITTGSITTAGLHPLHGYGGSVSLVTDGGVIVVNGSIDTRGANGFDNGFDSQYYGGTAGGNVVLDRRALDSLTGTAIQVSGDILTGGGSGLSRPSSTTGISHAGGLGGDVAIGNWIDECGVPGCDPVTGSAVIGGAINTSGGNGGSTSNAQANTQGGDAGGISIWASGSTQVGSVMAAGGNAGSGADGSYGNAGGWGGSVSLVTGGLLTTGAVNSSGGAGGNAGGSVNVDSYGGGGGSGGLIGIQGASIAIGPIVATGGGGGAGSTGAGYYESSGGNGGSGGGVQLYATAGAVSAGTIDGSGGAGGAGGVASDYAVGGSGGDGAGGLRGGQKLALIDGQAISLGGGIAITGASINVGTISALGGNGGAGGSVSTGSAYSDGGSGGSGGSVQLATTEDGFTLGTGPITTGVINVSGGTGANSGAIGTNDTYGGDGGDGGGISIDGSNVITGKLVARGGNAGSVTDSSMTSPAGTESPLGGWGGYGGAVYVYATGEANINVNGTLGAVAIDVSGGAGGQGGNAHSPAGDGGPGGDGGAVDVYGTPNMTLFGSVLAAGGAGGAGGAGNAGNPGGAGGSGGIAGQILLDAGSVTNTKLDDGIIFVLAGTQFNVEGGFGGAGGANEGAGGGSGGLAGLTGSFIHLTDYFGTIVVLDPLSVSEINQSYQSIINGADGSTGVIGGEKKDEDKDKSQKELGSCKG
ncbi:MAG: beta strand repeat-containing protein [Burkholderiales bacterium]